MDLEVRAFGPLEIWTGGVGTRVGSRLRQVLLGLLVVHQGGVVSASTLADRMWPAQRPAGLPKGLQIHVHRLRGALAGAGAVRYRPPGYALVVPRASVDLHRFEDLVRHGRAARSGGDEAAAAELLRQASALYRGPAFQGLEDVAELALESDRLAELRWSAVEERIAAELALGEHAALVPELSALVAEHPLRERLRAQLMTALYRAGRKADALAAYRTGRRILVDQLGVEPGQECRALERAILADDPALRPPAPVRRRRPRGTGPPPLVQARLVPAQLPPRVAVFAGRADHLRRLDRLLPGTREAAPGAMAVAVVDGPAGVGKTALAVHWAHRVRDRFADGQLYADLRGHSAGSPLSAVQVLARFLRALGVPPERMPTDVDEAASAFRSLLAGRRMLVVLDNAATADQVRPVLPGDGGCMVLVTSRDQLAGLVARDGAHRLTLDVLSPGESVGLLEGLLGAGRISAQPGPAAELAMLCGHLPLALRIAAASLAARPGQPLVDWVARLRDRDRLAVLAVPGDDGASVTGAFDLSYRRLPAPARRVFRLVGTVPCPELTAEAVAATTGDGPGRAGQVLELLARAHLVEELASGRYACHDLLRLYAAERALAEQTGPELAEARSGFYAYYLDTADAASRLLYPHALRLPREGPGQERPTRLADPVGALRWLDAEQANLAAIVAHTATHGPYRVAWRLADALRGFASHRMPIVDGLAVAEAGLTAAEADGEPRAQAAALVSSAGLRIRQGRHQEAGDLAGRALVMLRGTGWRDGEGVAEGLLGTACTQLGRPDRAAGHYQRALDLFEQTGWRYGQVGVVGNLGLVLTDLGRLAEAAVHTGRAAEVFAELGSPAGEAINLANLGDIHHQLGDLDRAWKCFTEARARYRAVGDGAEANAVRGLAVVHRDAGRTAQARELAELALTQARESGRPGLEPYCLNALASILDRGGEPAAAVDGYRLAADLARRAGDRYLEAGVLIGLAAVRPPAGGYGSARKQVTRALRIARAAGYRLLEGQALTVLAGIELATGASGQALALAERALAVHRSTGHRLGEARAHLVLGRASLAGGAADAAREHARRARRLFAAAGAQAPDQLAELAAARS